MVGIALAVAGPTAVGKTELAVRLAQTLGGELVNMDSRQVIRRLRVGTAAPTQAQLSGIPCHLMDLVEPGAPFSVADWVRLAVATLDDLGERGVPAILVGGTGQYLRALRQGWNFAAVPPDPGRRAELSVRAASPDGVAALAAELVARDPGAAATVDLANPRRVVRALELLATGAPSLAATRQRGGGVEVDTVVLDTEPAAHRAAVERRVAAMYDGGGLLAEVRTELTRGTTEEALRRCGIGYEESLDLLAGRRTPAEARAGTLRRTLRYAKAQRTWFRHEPAAVRLVRGDDGVTAELAGAVIAALRSSSAERPGGSRR